MNIELIAKICNNVIYEYCKSQYNFSETLWDIAPDWQKESAIRGVKFALENERTPEEMHEHWLVRMREEGWVYGHIMDSELKTHPCIQQYDELPEYQRTKCKLFKSVVNSFL